MVKVVAQVASFDGGTKWWHKTEVAPSCGRWWHVCVHVFPNRVALRGKGSLGRLLDYSSKVWI